MITKTNYVSFCKCPKSLYLSLFKKEEAEINEESIRKGNEVGALARSLFGEYVLVDDEYNDMHKKAEITKQFIEEGKGVICEASFIFKDLFCAVDILRKVDNGYELYEVRSTASLSDKEVLLHYYQDIAFQTHVLSKVGINVVKANLVLLNNKYIRNGDIELDKLLRVVNVTDEEVYIKETKKVRDNISKMRLIVDNPRAKIECKFSGMCTNGSCSFGSYCMRDISDDSVLNLYRCGKRFELYADGVRTFEDILHSDYKLSTIQRRQIDYVLNNRNDLYVDKDKINDFLEDIKYPMYFLDFESINEAIPPYSNCGVYQQVPVQFSLHVLQENGDLKHYEYVGDGVNDPRDEVARLLLEYIKNDGGSIVSYNASFEKGRIEELKEQLGYKGFDTFEGRYIDLLDVFRGGYIYNRKMGKSFSIKSTLPALFENDPELNYNSLVGVHNGGDAMKAYNSLKYLDDTMKEEVVNQLLKYCELDTYAMVKLYQKIVELAK